MVYALMFLVTIVVSLVFVSRSATHSRALARQMSGVDDQWRNQRTLDLVAAVSSAGVSANGPAGVPSAIAGLLREPTRQRRATARAPRQLSKVS